MVSLHVFGGTKRRESLETERPGAWQKQIKRRHPACVPGSPGHRTAYAHAQKAGVVAQSALRFPPLTWNRRVEEEEGNCECPAISLRREAALKTRRSHSPARVFVRRHPPRRIPRTHTVPHAREGFPSGRERPATHCAVRVCSPDGINNPPSAASRSHPDSRQGVEMTNSERRISLLWRTYVLGNHGERHATPTFRQGTIFIQFE